MIDFPNLQNISPVGRPGAGRRISIGRLGPAYTGAGSAAAADVVEISADAALKGKLSAFSAALAKEMSAADSGRVERLKAQYAGDGCPVSAADIAAAIVAGIRTEGSGNE